MHIVPWSSIFPICLLWQISQSFSSVSSEAPPILLELQYWKREKEKEKNKSLSQMQNSSMLNTGNTEMLWQIKTL